MNNPLPYTTNPRFLAQMLREREISPTDYLILTWLRNTADIMGIATTSLSDIKDDLSLKVHENTINKILRSLREKNFIDFQNRQGKRGSFQIRMGYWLLPKRNYRELPTQALKNKDEYRNLEVQSSNKIIEVSPKSTTPIPNLDEMKSQLVKSFSVDKPATVFPTSYNDKDTAKEIETLTVSSNGRTLTSRFHPRSHEEEAVLRIALALGEPHINPLLTALKDYGLEAIEGAYKEVKRRKDSENPPQNPGGYLMGIIKKRASKA